MSTSPSWFDQEKFSRLVKKTTAKGGAGQPTPSASISGSLTSPKEPENNGLLGEATPTEVVPAPEAKSPEAAPVESGSAAEPSQAKSEPAKPEPIRALPLKSGKPDMMTSQTLSLGKGIMPPPSVLKADDAPEPIRAPSQTSNISLASPAISPSVPPLPSLPRRTSPLPALKSVFPSDEAEDGSKPGETPIPSGWGEIPPARDAEPATPSVLAQSVDDLAAAWEKITQLNDDLRRSSQERDQAINEGVLLREQLKQADEQLKEYEENGAAKGDDASTTDLSGIEKERDELKAQLADVSHITAERDQIRRDYTGLREEFENLKQDVLFGKHDADNTANAETQKQLEEVRSQLSAKDEEISRLQASVSDQEETLRRQLSDKDGELDSLKAAASHAEDDLRRQLADKENEIETLSSGSSETEELRRQLEDKQSQIETLKNASSEVESLRQQLTAKDQEISTLKTGASSVGDELKEIRDQLSAKEKELESLKSSSGGKEEVIETLKKEFNSVQEQLKQAREDAAKVSPEQITQTKEEASIAQRGLALSQKALQETRDALREASESASTAKASMENLKKENSTLVQQNMLLQAQHDQLARELSASKAKLAAKG